jgi:hypothetical protein
MFRCLQQARMFHCKYSGNESIAVTHLCAAQQLKSAKDDQHGMSIRRKVFCMVRGPVVGGDRTESAEHHHGRC